MKAQWRVNPAASALLVAGLLGACASPGLADTHWQHGPAAPGDWFVAANWTAGVPAETATAYVDNGGSAVIASGQAQAGELRAGYFNGGAVHQTGGTGWLGGLYLGWQGPDAQGTYLLAGSAELYVAGTEAVGVWADGTFLHDGGVNAADELLIGWADAADGTYRLGGGYLWVQGDGAGAGIEEAGFEAVGVWGTGRFLHAGGINEADRLYVGWGAPAEGTYDLTAGELWAGGEWVGVEGTGRFTQSGGINSTAVLTLGQAGGAGGTYALSGGELSAQTVHVGADGAGTLTWTGGTLDAEDVHVGPAGRIDAQVDWTFGGSLSIRGGTVNLGASALTLDGGPPAGAAPAGAELADGTLAARQQCVGRHGSASFLQTGGTNLTASLQLAWAGDAQGLYELRAGALSAEQEWIGVGGAGTFLHSAGSNTVVGELQLGVLPGAVGAYGLSGGVLSAWTIRVGGDGAGLLSWTGGALSAQAVHVGPAGRIDVAGDWTFGGDLTLDGGELDLGLHRLTLSALGGTATAEILAGALWAGELAVAGGAGVRQLGGTCRIASGLHVGAAAGPAGRYSISAGRLEAAELLVGCDGAGSLELADPAAEVVLTGLLLFGPGAAFQAAPGAPVRLAGADLAVEGDDPAALAGLEDARLILAGTAGQVSAIEAAGADLGADPAGWVGNFALGALQLGEAGAAGRIELVDDLANSPGWAGPEALYVHELLLGPGAGIELGGLSLYYLNGGGPKQLFPGDGNLDGVVGYLDVGVLATNYGLTGGAWQRGDFNGDGMIDYLDAGILATHYGSGQPPRGGAPVVPEPAGAVLTALAAAAMTRRRRGIGASRSPADRG